ncbi:hypothetical protein CEF21_04835 [Bacillus sp. FJAT-42376]|uniref:copper resistance CopC family protein n=1 Tax=Bacillus sp. FJAT-42376 TaxID=2014076 RepID=UPI000F4E2A3A|nr:copper resistance CopC family protein [Bacillus sp. FJAT-42376]AZB41678.1 hypothetical protein CEF21_04835 [Bacillus sp. FJAT-42376]
MKKIIVLLLFAFLTFHQTGALAHSELESSNPEQGAEVTEKLNQIDLTFSTKIEESSTFKVSKDGTEVPVQNVQINGSTLTGTLPEQMENGSYTVNWDIVGADGHVIKDSMEFTLNVPAPAADSEEKTEQAPAAEKKEAPATEKKEAPAAKEKTASEPANDSTIVIIGSILAVAAVAAIFFSMRKGRR